MPAGEPLLNTECPEFLLSSIPQGGPRKCLSSLFGFFFFFLEANVDGLRKQVLETTGVTVGFLGHFLKLFFLEFSFSWAPSAASLALSPHLF